MEAHFAFSDLKSIDSERKKILDDLDPTSLDTLLARFLARSFDEIDTGLFHINLADNGTVEQLAPLDGKIDGGCGSEGHRHGTGLFEDLEPVDGVCAPDQMNVHIPNAPLIFRQLVELVVYVSFHHVRQGQAKTDETDE